LTLDIGIVPTAYFLVGNIGETELTLEKKLEFAKYLPAIRYRFSNATPYPGTAFRKLVDEQDLWISEALKRIRIFLWLRRIIS